MLLTRKSDAAQSGSSGLVERLQRGLSQALPTLDRRGFLRRSGLGVGVGLAATQLSLVKKADAASAGAGNGTGRQLRQNPPGRNRPCDQRLIRPTLYH